MVEYSNENRGAIWKNPKKEQDTHPDFTGSLNVDGVEYWVSAWKRKEGASEKSPALSFSVKPKEAKADHQNEKPMSQRPNQSAVRRRDDDDFIPF